MITKDNCEAYFLDYHEGNLNAEAIAELMLFLELNPGYREAFESFEELVLETPIINFEQKESIKKSFALSDDDYISYIEQVANADTVAKVEDALFKSSFVKNEMELFKKTILTPELVTYPNKKSLKQKEARVIPMFLKYAAAAAIAVLITTPFLFQNQGSNTLAVVNENIETNVPTTTHKEHATTTTKIDVIANSKISSSKIKPHKLLATTSHTITKAEKITATTPLRKLPKNSTHIITSSSSHPEIAVVATEINSFNLLGMYPHEEAASNDATKKEILGLREQLIAQMTDIKSGKPKKEERLLLFANVTKKLFKKAPVKTHAEYDENNNIIAYSVDFRNIHFEKK